MHLPRPHARLTPSDEAAAAHARAPAPSRAAGHAFAACLLAVVLPGGTAGCRSPSHESARERGPRAKVEAAEPDTPGRVVSVTVFSDEVLWRLGPSARARVAAVSSMADDPEHSSVAGQWPQALPRVAGVAEQILAAAPDPSTATAVVASFTMVETREALRGAGFELVVLEHFRGFDDYRDSVRRIAAAVEAEAEAETLLEAFERRRAGLARAPDPNDPITVVSWSDGSVPGADTSFDDVARLVGLENLAATHGRAGHGRVTGEQLVTWNPDWLVVPCGPPGDDASCAAAISAAKRDPALASTRAVRAAQVIAVPTRELYAVGEGMLDLATTLTERIHGA